VLRSSEIKPLFVDLSLSDKSFLFISCSVRRFRHRYLSTTLSVRVGKNVLCHNGVWHVCGKPITFNYVDLSLSDKSFLFISFWVRRFRHRYLSTTLSVRVEKNVLCYNGVWHVCGKPITFNYVDLSLSDKSFLFIFFCFRRFRHRYLSRMLSALNKYVLCYNVMMVYVDLSLSDKSFLFIFFCFRRFRHRYISTTLSTLSPQLVGLGFPTDISYTIIRRYGFPQKC